ncbi:ribosome biogenesis protein ytm1 [Blastocladiella emersonii ATCC 22665]|nr:ribosome biogenesis protein ytm1 [Blastocladiella emersonii ATCC 22665]
MSQVQVKFYTAQTEYSVPGAAILVPTNFKRRGLSEVINHLLGKAEGDQVNFDFLIDGVLLRTTLDAYLAQHNLSVENTLSVEYVVALPPPKPVASFQADDWISAVLVPSADRVVSAGYDGVVRLWNREGETLTKLQIGTAPLKAATLLPSAGAAGIRVAVAGMNQKVSVVHMEENGEGSASAKVVCDLVGHTGTIEGIAFASASDNLYSGAWDGSIKVFNISESSLQNATAAPAAKKQKKQATASAAAEAVTVGAPQLQPTGTMTGHVGAVNTVALGGRDTLYSGGNDHSVRVWDLSTHSNVVSMSCEKVVRSVAYSDSARLVASAHADPAIRLWDPRAQEATLVKARLLGHRNQVAQIAWSPSSPFHLASASLDGSVRVFDTRSPSQALHVVAHPTPLKDAAVVPTHEADHDAALLPKAPVAKRLCVNWAHGLVVSGGEDCMLNVWEEATEMAA